MDLDCPVELHGFEVLHDDRENARIYARLNNLSEKGVLGFQAIVRWIDRKRSQSGEMNYTAENLRVAPRGRFTVSFFAESAPHVDDIEMAFTTIHFDDGTNWTGDLNRVIDISPIPDYDGRELNELAAVAGEDAICFAEQREGWWRCVCGRANSAEKELCARCRRGKDTALAQLNRETVLSGEAAWLPESLKPEERDYETPFRMDIPEKIAEENEEEAYAPSDDDLFKLRRQRNLLIRRTVTLVVLVTLIVFITWLWGVLNESKARVGDVIPPVPITTTDPDTPR